MYLSYEKKTPIESVLTTPPLTTVVGEFTPCSKMLFHGDNVDAMKLLLSHGYAGKIDLVYIDPPFATSNVFTIGNERVSTISGSKKDKVAYSDTLTGADFLEFLRHRLILLRELLSDRGSIYLHIDYKIGHYVKVIMDEIFGMENFRNDISRIKCNPKNFSRQGFGNIKDMVLFYGKSKNAIWNEPREEIGEADLKKRFSKVDANGRYYTTVPLHAPGETKSGKTGGLWRGMMPPPGRHWRCAPEELEELDKQGLIEWSKTGNPRRIIYADESARSGKKMQDVWMYKDAQYPTYPTEKNLEMLKMIVSASSNPESIVLDCFCGSGSTLLAAELLGRGWIGIDKSDVAIEVTEKKLKAQISALLGGYQKFQFQQEFSLITKQAIS